MASSSPEYTVSCHIARLACRIYWLPWQPQLGNVVRLKLRDWIVLLHTRDLDSQDVREGPWRVVAEAAVPTTGKVSRHLAGALYCVYDGYVA